MLYFTVLYCTVFWEKDRAHPISPNSTVLVEPTNYVSTI